MSPRLAALLAALALCACGGGEEASSAGSAPLAEVRDCALRVAFRPVGYPAFVGVAASFSGFDATAHPMTPDADGVWRATLRPPPGHVQYRVEVDGRPFLDDASPLSARVDGVEWSSAYVEDCSAPGFRLVEHRPDTLELTLRRLEAEHGLDGGSVRALAGDQPLSVRVEGDRVLIDLRALAYGKHHLTLTGRDTLGREAEPLRAPFWHQAERFRWADAVIYQVMLDRFAAEAPFTAEQRATPPGERVGGTVRGLLATLRDGYFERLGVDVLWISPLNRNPAGLWVGVEGGPPRYAGYHGYWPMSPRAVEPAFGTSDDVEALVAEAHARGIRVIMDVVLNHVHTQHPYFLERPEWFGEACACGSAACPWYSHIQTCWFTPYLPDFNWDDVAQLDTQIDDALWWIERFDLDGLRVDAVPMMPRFVTRHLTARVHREREALRARHYLLGETFTGADGWDQIRWYLGPDGLDGQFDFPVMWALRAAFAWESVPLWTLFDVWTESEAAWAGSTAVMGQFVGNHDVTRFLSEAAGHTGGAWTDPPPAPEDALPYQRLALAQTFALTVPGAPILYYGDELGMPGMGDPDNRRPMRFDGERSALERDTARTVARLGRLRRCLPALRRAPFTPLRVEAERLMYLRDLGDGAPAAVVLQRDPDDLTVQVPLPPDAPDGPYLEVLSGRRVERTASGLAPFALAPRTPAVLLPADHPCGDDP